MIRNVKDISRVQRFVHISLTTTLIVFLLSSPLIIKFFECTREGGRHNPQAVLSGNIVTLMILGLSMLMAGAVIEVIISR